MKLTSRTSLFLSSAITESWNALIDSSSDAKEISGVIDLDEAEVVPIPVARRPPIWPWHFSKEPETGFLNSDQCSDPELNREGQALKDLFDTKAKKALLGYHEDAYGYGRWLRKVFSYCKQAYLIRLVFAIA